MFVASLVLLVRAGEVGALGDLGRDGLRFLAAVTVVASFEASPRDRRGSSSVQVGAAGPRALLSRGPTAVLSGDEPWL
jgi:hypothetical protein